ncbi:MAG TPA: alpha/beta fold hydrolase [Burkholderiaceae bacterium]|nr:alpha/beta fold hydrolase [Burkholderiaceae bacterium]
MPTLRHGRLCIDYADAGQGPPVVLVHSSASSNRQWRRLIDRLSPRNRVIAPNLMGNGATTAWHGQRPQTLADAAEVVMGVIEGLQLDTPLALVGHSWGGAIALHAAQVLGERVAKLVLYEPMLPGLLTAHGRQAAAETQALHAHLQRCARSGDWLAAAERFTEYFNGDGAWAATPPERRQLIAGLLPPNLPEWDAATAPQRAEAFAGVCASTLLMRGRTTRPALVEMASVLYRHFAHWRLVDVAGCGHMAPLTHADVINAWIADFLDDDGDCGAGATAAAAALQ